MYWSGDDLFLNFAVSSVMPRDRFDKIRQYFHANRADNKPIAHPGHDKLHHVQAILERVRHQCLDMNQPH